MDVQFDDTYIGPEPASYFLFGSGLLILGATFPEKLIFGRAV
jgi:hypothetical protein